MANLAHVELVKKGTASISYWRKKNPELILDLNGSRLANTDLAGADLSRADLTGAVLSNADLSGARLRGADLRNANLLCASLFGSDLEAARLAGSSMRQATLSGSNLSGVDMRRADLTSCDLRAACLHGANLARANLAFTNFTGAKLRGCNLSESELSHAIFSLTDVSNASGLETVESLSGPIVLGTDVLLSQGHALPPSFLQLCGLPAQWIERLPSFMATVQSVQCTSCLLVYEAADKPFARRLYDRMRHDGISTWLEEQGSKGALKAREADISASRFHNNLVLVLSPESEGSAWARHEIQEASKLENAAKQRALFVVKVSKMRHSASHGGDADRELHETTNEYHFPDLSRWGGAADFDHSYSRLLEGLKRVAERFRQT